MKKLVTAADVKNLFGSGQKALYTEPGMIITPAARDTAAELGLLVQAGPPPEPAAPDSDRTAAQIVSTGCAGETGAPVTRLGGISPALIAQIVKEVLASMPGVQQEPGMVSEEDPGGLRLIRGRSVQCEPFNTGNPRDKVGIKEILNTKESPNMATGFMTIENTAFSWDLKYEELDYVIDGSLEITVNGKTYRGGPGDVFYIPRNTTVTFSAPDKAKFFFVTYPANWAELSNYQK